MRKNECPQNLTNVATRRHRYSNKQSQAKYEKLEQRLSFLNFARTTEKRTLGNDFAFTAQEVFCHFLSTFHYLTTHATK
jgi:hypothetical protein